VSKISDGSFKGFPKTRGETRGHLFGCDFICDTGFECRESFKDASLLIQRCWSSKYVRNWTSARAGLAEDAVVVGVW